MNVPDRDPEAPNVPNAAGDACARARASLGSWLRDELDLKARARRRAHLSGCASCREHAERVLAAAPSMRSERPPARAAGVARAATFSRSSAAPLSARLRVLLLPAFFLVLMVEATRPSRGGGGPTLGALLGDVRLDGRALAPGAAPQGARAGDACVTGADGSARLSLGASSARLESGTWAWLESASELRVRLGGGVLVVHGPAVVTCALGVVEVDRGAARVRLDAAGLAVDPLVGEVRLVDHRGVRRLPSADGEPGRSGSIGGRAPAPEPIGAARIAAGRAASSTARPRR